MEDFEHFRPPRLRDEVWIRRRPWIRDVAAYRDEQAEESLLAFFRRGSRWTQSEVQVLMSLERHVRWLNRHDANEERHRVWLEAQDPTPESTQPTQ